MIENLIHIFNKIGLTPNAEEIADVLWLASYLDEPESSGMPKIKPSQDHIDSSAEIPKPDMKKPEDQDQTVSSSPESKTGVYPPESEGKEISDSGMGGLPFRSPAASALPGQLAIERALRPLMRKVPSRSRFVLDEDATVRQIAETDIWLPVMRPEPSRWLDVILVVDESRSMAIWHQTISELKSLLERQGAFRNVRLQSFETSRKNPKELIDPSRQRLILLISDCVSEAWYDGSAANMMSAWKNNSLIAIVQMLPHWLWERTALDYAESVYLRASYPGTVNAQLDIEQSDAWFDEKPAQGFPIPVITLEPLPMSSWAKSVAGLGGKWIPGVVLQTSPCEDTEPEESQKSLSPEEQFRLFKATASPTARRLAGYLAAVPLTLPIMRLVQQVMMPQTPQIHLAEVFLSGLIKRRETEETLHPDMVRYEFIEGIRDILISSNLISETVDVIGKVANEVSAFIDKNTGKPMDFHALIADPSLADQALFAEDRQAFAYVSAHVLSRLGGKYAELAKRIERINHTDFIEFINKINDNSTIRNGHKSKGIILSLEEDYGYFCIFEDTDDAGGWDDDYRYYYIKKVMFMQIMESLIRIGKANFESIGAYSDTHSSHDSIYRDDDYRYESVKKGVIKADLTIINGKLNVNSINFYPTQKGLSWEQNTITTSHSEEIMEYVNKYINEDGGILNIQDIELEKNKDIERQNELSVRTKYELRNTPITVSDKEFKKVFGLDENLRPLGYIHNNFKDNGDGTISDYTTGLMWQKAGSDNYIKHENVNIYIQELNSKKFAGFNDWRLPTVDELKSLLTPKKMDVDLYIDPIFDKTQSWCWTSDKCASGGAWIVYFSYGFVSWYYIDFYLYVRAVRSRQFPQNSKLFLATFSMGET